MTDQIWYVHGANSTCTSFNYIKKCLPTHNQVDFEYGQESDLDRLSDELLERLSYSSRHQVDVISHSLGGVVATIAAQKQPSYFRKIVTIASPFGGCEAADFLKWIYMKIPLYGNVCTANKNIVRCISNGAAVDTLSIITTLGNDTLMWHPNDGVVSVDSQTKLKGIQQVVLSHHHHDVLQADDTVEAINSFLFKDLT